MQQSQAESHCTVSLPEALKELDRVAPAAPLLALGQTIFWDEPMKAGVAQMAQAGGNPRRLIAGVHDTDYLAKLPSGKREKGQFKAVPHNDTTTRGLWSAAAEFSALFGSETVVTREALQAAGLKFEKIAKGRPQILDQATEAWGWKGIVSLDEEAPVTADVKLEALYPELKATLDWAIDASLQSVSEPQRIVSTERADHLKRLVEDAYRENPGISLADFYKQLLPAVYSFASGEESQIDSTKTSVLLRFNRKTCSQPRFDLVDLFISPDSRDAAHAAYNEALKGAEIYSLERFGTGAIPFDIVVPGRGRGTLRIGTRGIVISTRDPLFISLKKPLESVQDLAEAICAKFGDSCVLIGKAVTLIGMLAREFVFVFHEGASSYVKYTRIFHKLLADSGHRLNMNPILRVRLQAWDALGECNTWFRLPEPFQGPFGTEELAAPSFAARWREVAADQQALLTQLGKLKSPLELIRFLEERTRGSWKCLAREYDQLHSWLEQVERQINELKTERWGAYRELKALKQKRVESEVRMGRHFREKIYEKQPKKDDLTERGALHKEVEEAIHSIAAMHRNIQDLLKRQREFVSAPEIRGIHERRRAIELEAELKRLRLIRQAVITSKGLAKASHRPSAWWFPILCPDGGWFRATIEGAQAWLEDIGGD